MTRPLTIPQRRALARAERAADEAERRAKAARKGDKLWANFLLKLARTKALRAYVTVEKPVRGDSSGPTAFPNQGATS